MERREHGQGGNCLFHWPAARGEEANGKRYESVCPPRWWIRLKLEEEGFQSPRALDFSPVLSTLNCFPSFVQRPVPFFLNLTFWHFIYIFSKTPPASSAPLLGAAHRGVVGLHRLTGGASWGRGGGGRGQPWQTVGQKAWGGTAFSWSAAGTVSPRSVMGRRDLEQGAGRENTPWWVCKASMSASLVCKHTFFSSKGTEQSLSWITVKPQDFTNQSQIKKKKKEPLKPTLLLIAAVFCVSSDARFNNT